MTKSIPLVQIPLDEIPCSPYAEILAIRGQQHTIYCSATVLPTLRNNVGWAMPAVKQQMDLCWNFVWQAGINR